jgi:hypothetical protein
MNGNQTDSRSVNESMQQTYTPAGNGKAGIDGSILPVWTPPDAPTELRLYLGPNDGGIQRGDRDETGDNEARPTEKGSGDAHGIVDRTAFGGESSISHPASSHFDLESERDDFDGIEIMQADDGRLGLTNTDRVLADDWAADSGETAVPDAEE